MYEQTIVIIPKGIKINYMANNHYIIQMKKQLTKTIKFLFTHFVFAHSPNVQYV